MAIKTSTAAALQHGHRRRFRQQAMLPLSKRSSQLAARFGAEKRQIWKQHQKGQNRQEQSAASSTSSATATPEPATPPAEHDTTTTTTTNEKQTLQHILGRSIDDKDRSAADILATLYRTGLLDRHTPAASDRSGTATPVGDDVQPSEVALPSMQQTEVMLEVWRSEGAKAVAPSASDAGVDDQPSSLPMTPALSASSASARSSFSSAASPTTQHAHMPSPSPSGPPPPPYDQWRKSIAADAGVFAPKPLPLPRARPAQPLIQSPFATYEQNYFCSSRQSIVHAAAGPNGMPSPPQSPTAAGRPRHAVSKPTLPPLSSTLPTPPQSFSASMQPAMQPPAYQPHALYGYGRAQYELPAPLPSVPRRSLVNEDIATTVLTLPPPAAATREPITPVSPLTLPSAFGRRSTVPAMSMASMVNPGPYHYHHHPHHDLSPRMAAKMDARRERVSASAASSSVAVARKSMPKPHCNVKYETAELDFIMYQRTTKNRAWDDVTASFNAALPRLRQYADMDYARLGASAADKMDRHRARPERTTPGLQASYYRQRLALPLLNDAGELVFDDASNKQLFTEVMVRDDKSRKKMRRLTATAPLAPLATPPKGDDARVHLVLYFPERVTYYDYWFVSEEDKALARQRTYERNRQRHQRGLPAWQPGNDDPDSGILTRSKE